MLSIIVMICHFVNFRMVVNFCAKRREKEMVS
jgi:hypothetical protein